MQKWYLNEFGKTPKLQTEKQRKITDSYPVKHIEVFREKPKRNYSVTSFNSLGNIRNYASIGHIDILGNFQLKLSSPYYENKSKICEEIGTSLKKFEQLIYTLKIAYETTVKILYEISLAEYNRHEKERLLLGLISLEYAFSSEEIYEALRIHTFNSMKDGCKEIEYNSFNYPKQLLIL